MSPSYCLEINNHNWSSSVLMSRSFVSLHWLSGKDFNEKYRGRKLVKNTTESCRFDGILYKDGLVSLEEHDQKFLIVPNDEKKPAWLNRSHTVALGCMFKNENQNDARPWSRNGSLPHAEGYVPFTDSNETEYMYVWDVIIPDTSRVVVCETDKYSDIYVDKYIISHKKELWNRSFALDVANAVFGGLAYIPERFKDIEICVAGIKYNDPSKYIPRHIYNSPEFWYQVSEVKPWYVLQAPKNILSEGMLIKYVTSEPYNFRRISRKFQTYALCMTIVEIDGDSLRFVRECFKDEPLCTVAVKQNGSALRFIPKNFDKAHFKPMIEKWRYTYWLLRDIHEHVMYDGNGTFYSDDYTPIE